MSVEDAVLVAYADERCRALISSDARVTGVILIGSQAYPEFARADSDVDLLVLFADSGEHPLVSLSLDYAEIGGANRLIEARLIPEAKFQPFVATCDVSLQFGFVRGFRILVAPEDVDVEFAIRVAIGRFRTDALVMLADMRRLGAPKIADLCRLQYANAKAGIDHQRSSGNRFISEVLSKEALKDFLSQLWMGCILNMEQPDRMSEVAIDSGIVKEVGLLRTFLAPRGGRMLLNAKYPKGSGFDAIAELFLKCSLGQSEELAAAASAAYRQVFEADLQDLEGDRRSVCLMDF